MKMITLTFNLFCLTANIYHIYWLSANYFQYGVISAVTVQHRKDEKLVLPSVSFRFEIEYTFRWENMTDDMKMRLLTCNNTLGIYDQYGGCVKSNRRFVYEDLEKDPSQLSNASF